MRLFLSIPLPDSLQRRLVQLQEELASFNWKVRWTPPEQLHLTLHFLGETPENLIEDLHHEMAALCHARWPFDLSAGGLGAFPSFENPRVLWAGLHDHGEKLKELFEASYRLLKGYRIFELRKEFTPHLTLGRVGELSQAWDPSPIKGLLPQWKNLGALPVENLRLMRSHLNKEGARHEVVESYALRG
jgi:2'-5' RNA ligase